MRFEEIKGRLEWRKHAFECEIENAYDIEIHNGMTRMHDNEVNHIYECNLLHDILNNPE